MANEEHVRRLVMSTAAEWNAWRAENPQETPDLSGVVLDDEFSRVPHDGESIIFQLLGRDLRDALLVSTDFKSVDINGADFASADVECAWWDGTVFNGNAYQVGLEGVLDEGVDDSLCDEHCSRRRDAAYPADCDRRCNEVLSPNENHVAKLLGGVKVWNEWRDKESTARPNLSGIDLRGTFRESGLIEDHETIDLSSINFKGVILRGAKFRDIKMDRSIFDASDLRCTEWSAVNLTASTFLDADMRNAKMSLSNMNGCDFNAAKTSGLRFDAVRLSRAVLRWADLRDNSLGSSDLSFADLSAAHMCGATIAGSNLTGARLYGSRIWKTTMFKGDLSERFNHVRLEELPIVDKLQTLFEELTKVRILTFRDPSLTFDPLERYDERRSSIAFFYRGHGDIKWDLRPTVFRCRSFTLGESDLMSELASRHPDAFREDVVFFQRLVRARHFELPTRLLDVTSNPLTALYYATEPTRPARDGVLQIFIVDREMEYPFDSDTVSLVSNFTRLSFDQQRALLTKTMIGESGVETRTDAGRDSSQNRYDFAMTRLHHFVAGEKPHWENRIKPVDLFKVLLVKPASSFARLKAHEGAFLMSAYHHDLDPFTVNDKVPGSGKYRRVALRVPHDAKQDIRNDLDIVGVNEESLKSDLGSTAKAIGDEIRRRPAPRLPRWWEE